MTTQIIAKEFIGVELVTVCQDSSYGDHFWAIDGVVISRGDMQSMLDEAIRHKKQYNDWVSR